MPTTFKNLKSILIIFCALTLSGCAITFPFTKTKEKQKPVQIFIGQDNDTITDYIQNFADTPQGFLSYTSLKNLEGLREPADYGSGIQYAQYLRDTYPSVELQLGLYLVGTLSDINKGLYDENIKKLGLWIKQSQTTVYLRIGYEFDYPENNYDPIEYKHAFRRIVESMRKEKVENVQFVWHSYGGYAENRMKWYPGDEFVDWFGISFFDPYNQGNMEFMAKRASEHNKPFMIAESTPKGIDLTQGEKAWNKWFVRYFKFIDKHNIKIACYINSDWESLEMFQNKGWGNARLQDNEFIKQQWNKQIKNN